MSIEKMLKGAFGDIEKMMFRQSTDTSDGNPALIVGCTCGSNIAEISPAASVEENILKIVIHSTADCEPSGLLEDTQAVPSDQRHQRARILKQIPLRELAKILDVRLPDNSGQGYQILDHTRNVIIGMWTRGELTEGLTGEDFYLSPVQLKINNYDLAVGLLKDFDLLGEFIAQSPMTITDAVIDVVFCYLKELMAQLNELLHNVDRINRL